MAKKHTAPKYLTGDAKKKWEGTYDAALKQAKIDSPNDENTQFATAHKEANKMLSIPAPDSAKAIDEMEEWQIVPGSRLAKVIDGTEHKVCVTIDGRKHAHPVKKQAAPKADPAPKP